MLAALQKPELVTHLVLFRDLGGMDLLRSMRKTGASYPSRPSRIARLVTSYQEDLRTGDPVF